MKFLLLIVFVFNLYGDEIQRINSIVDDITKLRMDYKASQKELSECRKKVKSLENRLNRVNNLLNSKEKNTFPQLKMRKNIIHTKAATYRMKRDANIYDAPNGKKIDEWSKGRSFTSTQQAEGFIRITGYFENKQWKKAQKSLWVDIRDAYKREK